VSSSFEIGKSLSNEEYLRERIRPTPGDMFYLTLSDLKLALEKTIKKIGKENQRILDFGCGGSPYRELFGKKSKYVRADLAGTPCLDFEMDPRSAKIRCKGRQFDLIFSSQVLEHVESTALYLKEAKRLLKPGGSLLLSTHGTFQDHPCPNAYWRWTGSGLKKELAKAGFKTTEVQFLTTGPRAGFAILEMNIPRLGRGNVWSRNFFRIIEWFLEKLQIRKLIHKALDRFGSHYRVVRDLPPFSGVYIILLVTAVPDKQ